jgi:hypothetical protein
VVAVELLLNDWSPVDVVFSIVRLERPRRSMFDGLTVLVEPVIVLSVLVEEPVIELVELAVEPLTDGLTVLEPLVLAVVPASLSGMQSMCTALFECSFARPGSLSASLPACG